MDYAMAGVLIVLFWFCAMVCCLLLTPFVVEAYFAGKLRYQQNLLANLETGEK
jgi:hypothetical protein